ncbi:phenylacetic acid degradation protein paaN [Herbaspirillum sp. CF444]|uniref:phenylacetic acid degradation protein PaaN n=1 Tax=Herbaspirillum sp. CF444 TaxID=1144319 RepID=UPI0002722D53|nr:phenylacetic acid degradation protein PaaN [Herbaspirillum sp. CF444]EJL90900.1 phenylacetic acid degradation protein paaN [Herbaspirillum sp. CF444]
MTTTFFERHRATLDTALQAIAERGYWSPYSESPSPRVYGETAADDGKTAYDAHLNRPFEIDQAGTVGGAGIGNEVSPYGPALGITYPKTDVDQLLQGVAAAGATWRKAGPEVWTGVALEIVARLNARSFEIAHAVMHTTGQAYMMAFQAGGPHAQDRAVEAIAYAWQETSRIPAGAHWEKPQGKHDPLKMQKSFRIVPRGIGLVIGCCTFPTWNSYPGLFADLATGNAVIVKPHPGAILPLAITVEIARAVIAEAGYHPDVVTLVAHEAGDKVATELALRPEIKLIDFTGSAANGNWLERNAVQAQVFTEKSGVNQIIIDSTADFKGMARNIAFSLVLYSGQMCTTPQNIYIPKDGIATAEGHVSFDAVVAAIGEAINKLTGDPAKAVELLGAIQNTAVLDRIEAARKIGDVVLDSTSLQHPQFPEARIRTPLLVKAADGKAVTEEFFGPISFAIATDSTAAGIALAEKTVREHGALSLSAYTTSAAVKQALGEAAADAGVALSLNLTGGVFVNQSAAFSDYHGTGANPAANAALADSAFVAGRFRVVQTREPV